MSGNILLHCVVIRTWLLNVSNMTPGGIKGIIEYAYDAFGTGIHSSYVIDYVVKFDVKFKSKNSTCDGIRFIFHALGCF